MNNAIFRSGHLQNAITIDQNVLERTEILFGPSSVMYGSDALGGVVHYYTLLPEYSKEGFKVNSNAFVRYSSANNEKTGHLNFSLRNKKWTSFTGLSYSDFGDLRMGGTTNPSYPRFGIEKYYADRIDGKDTMVLKDDLLLQKGTAYSQWGAIQKFRFKINDSVEVVLNTQYSTSSDIPRYDQLTDYKGDKLKFAEWYYGPQNRLFSALAVEVNKPAWLYSRFKVIGAYQKIDEDRYERKFNNPNRSVNQEDVQVVSANIDLFKDYGTTKTLSYGGEAYFNDVVSTAYKENIENGTTSPEQTRYPDDGSKYNSFAVYTSFKNHFHPKATYHIGARYNMVTLLAGFKDTTFVKLPFNKIEFSNASLTASAGLAYQPNERWNIGLNASSGFRSPNVDDVGKVFSKNDYVMVPNNEVKPEYAYSGEFNLTHSLLDEKVKISGTVFYTFVKDMIVRKPYTLNGADSLVYDGEKLKIQTNLNSDKAEISGFSISLDVTLTKEFKVLSSLSKTYANSLTDTLPVAHIPPLYGRTDFLLQIDELFLDVYLVYNAQKPISEFSLTGEDNADKATADGSPAWYTINIASTINLSKKIALQLGMENLLDVHYRTFSSGVSAPGRNFIAALRASF
jgi:hemoglobin/transferrin/lactoferrin receptor protein